MKTDLLNVPLTRSVAISVASAVLILVIAIAHMSLFNVSKLDRVAHEQIQQVNATRSRLDLNLDIYLQDLLLLAEEVSVVRHLDQATLASFFTLFIKHRPVFDQIRLLKLDGEELIRVNQKGGNPETVTQQDLQNKSQRYYVQQAIQLQEHQIYVSPFDLNVENGVIEQPHKPTIRIAAPVKDVDGNVSSIIIINLLGQTIVDLLADREDYPGKLMLLNDDGFWLIGGDNNWGFMVGDGASFASENPAIWEQVSGSESGQLSNDNFTFAYQSIQPFPQYQQTRRWIILSQMPHSSLQSIVTSFIQTYGFIYLFAWFAISLVLLLVDNLIHHYRQINGQRELLKLGHAVSHSPSMVMVTNSIGQLEFVNKKFTEVTGYHLTDVAGRRPSFLQSGDRPQNDYVDLWKMINSGQEWRGDFKNIKKDGSTYWASAAISPVFNDDSEIIYYVCVQEDITEKRRLSSALHEQQQINLKNEKLAMIGTTANMIAHDMRNPLSSIRMTLQLIEKHNISNPEELRGVVGDCYQQIDYMNSILEGILQYSKENEYHADWCDLSILIRRAVLQCQQSNQVVDIQCQHLSAVLPRVHVDEFYIIRAFVNLLDNACQASKSAGKTCDVKVFSQLSSAGEPIIIIVNQGQLADPESDYFEPFKTTKAKGTGLGLAIVKRIFDDHGIGVALKDSLQHAGCVEATLTFHTRQSFTPGFAAEQTT